MPFTQARLKQVFGGFSYRDDPERRGAVIVDPRWVGRNIVEIRTPLGTFPCHRLCARQMKDFIDRGVAGGLINDIGGIWVPRHVLWDPAKPLSGHAYGCDVDLNVDDGRDGPGGELNYGRNSGQPAALLRLAAAWGFEWGGAWRSARDGMHFSCIRIMGEGDSPVRARHSRAPVRLSLGSKGAAVKELQRLLNAHGYRLDTDGLFGSLTRAAVLDWQRSKGLVVDGVVGPVTWGSLGRQ